MKILLLFTTLIILSVTKLIAQNLFFIGDKSYPCTEIFKLKSNSDFNGYDLDVLIAKNGEIGMLVLSTQSMTGVLIRGQVIVYLDDGTVISCIDRSKYDYVDNKATSVYFLTKGEIGKLMNSNIQNIRFTLKCRSEYASSSEEGDYSASNKSNGYELYSKERSDVPELIKELFK